MVIWPTGRCQNFGHVPLQLILSIPGNTELEEKVSQLLIQLGSIQFLPTEQLEMPW